MFFWSRSSKLINSTLSECELRSDERVMKVENTQVPIKMQIRRELPRPIAYQHWLLQERPLKELVNYHKLEVKHDNSLHIEFKPMNYCMNYHIYIKYGSRPSRDNYDRNWTLPDLSTCNHTGSQDAIRRNICLIYQDVVDPSLRYQFNGSSSNVNCTLRDFLDKRIKKALNSCTLDPYKVYLLDSETKNGTYYFGKTSSEFHNS